MEFVPDYVFNHMKQFLTEDHPAEVVAVLENYQMEVKPALVVEKDEAKKKVLITDKDSGLVIKMKFNKMNLSDEDDDRMVVRFLKKGGSIVEFNEVMKDLLVYMEELMIDDENDQL